MTYATSVLFVFWICLFAIPQARPLRKEVGTIFWLIVAAWAFVNFFVLPMHVLQGAGQ
jgi:hypothetical protein